MGALTVALSFYHVLMGALDTKTLQVARHVFLEENLKLVAALEKLGADTLICRGYKLFKHDSIEGIGEDRFHQVVHDRDPDVSLRC